MICRLTAQGGFDGATSVTSLQTDPDGGFLRAEQATIGRLALSLVSPYAASIQVVFGPGSGVISAERLGNVYAVSTRSLVALPGTDLVFVSPATVCFLTITTYNESQLERYLRCSQVFSG